MAFEADWSYAYFIDTRRIPSALQLALVLLDAASVPVGFVVGCIARASAQARSLCSRSVRRRLDRADWHRSFRRTPSIQASYAQFHGDFGTRPVAGSSLGYALLWMDTAARPGRRYGRFVRFRG